MQKSTSIWMLLAAVFGLFGCSDGNNDVSKGDAAPDVRLNGAPDTSEAEGPIQCGSASLCRFTREGISLRGQSTVVENFCTHQRWPNSASAGIYFVCMIDPQGNAYFVPMGGSLLLDTPGWTHEAYGGIVIPSTLSAPGKTLCDEVRATFIPTMCPASDVGIPDGGMDTRGDTATDANKAG